MESLGVVRLAVPDTHKESKSGKPSGISQHGQTLIPMSKLLTAYFTIETWDDIT